MREIGAKGGSVSPQTRLRKAADDGLRESAREVLADALAGKAVDKAQLDAARSLYSYRPSEVPRVQEREQQHGERGVFSLENLILTAVQLGLVTAVDGQVMLAGQPVEATHGGGTPSEKKGRPNRWVPGSPPQNLKPESKPEPLPPVLPSPEEGPDFDESAEAVLQRRYGGPGEWRWT